MPNSQPDDAELERLLAQLLRVVATPADGSAPSAASFPEAYATPAGEDGRLPAVSGSEARALIELMSARGIAQGELAALLRLDKSTVSRLAAGLERKGWLRRGRDEGNQRYVRLYLTADGGAIAERVWQAWHSRQARLLAGLSEDERAGLSVGLRGIIRGLATDLGERQQPAGPEEPNARPAPPAPVPSADRDELRDSGAPRASTAR